MIPKTAEHRYPPGHGIDIMRLAMGRLDRLQAQIRGAGLGGCLLFDPINIRYATETSNMQVWILHNKARYVFVPPEGGCVLFDYPNCEEFSESLPTISEIRPTHGIFYLVGGSGLVANMEVFARDLRALLDQFGGSRRLGVDVTSPMICSSLLAHGVEVVEGQGVCEQARVVKTPEEIAAIRLAVAGCEAAMVEMESQLQPGITENALWAHLHYGNIVRGGEWIETRLLSSGARTFPWMQEASHKPIAAGELVTYDTDMVGVFGYSADISRSLVCGADRATDEQRFLHHIARCQLEHNRELLRPGVGFMEFSEKSYQLPERFFQHRYSGIAHGLGMVVEYPYILYGVDAARQGSNHGELLEGMVINLESVIGDARSGEAVKLEEQYLITATGCEQLSSHPYDAVLDRRSEY